MTPVHLVGYGPLTARLPEQEHWVLCMEQRFFGFSRPGGGAGEQILGSCGIRTRLGGW